MSPVPKAADEMPEFPGPGLGCPLCDDGAGDAVSQLLAELDAASPALAELLAELDAGLAEFEAWLDAESAKSADALAELLRETDPGGPVCPGGCVGGLGGGAG